MKSNDLNLTDHKLERSKQTSWDGLAQCPYESSEDEILSYTIETQGGSHVIGWAPPSATFDSPYITHGYFLRPYNSNFEGCRKADVASYPEKMAWASLLEVTTVYNRKERTISFSIADGPLVVAFSNVMGDLIPSVSFYGSPSGDHVRMLHFSSSATQQPAALPQDETPETISPTLEIDITENAVLQTKDGLMLAIPANFFARRIKIFIPVGSFSLCK